MTDTCENIIQPQPVHVLKSHIWNVFMYVFLCLASLIKTIINCCYWQFGWILFYSRNIHINALTEAEPDILGILWLSLSQNMKCLYFLNEIIFSQIATSNSELWS